MWNLLLCSYLFNCHNLYSLSCVRYIRKDPRSAKGYVSLKTLTAIFKRHNTPLSEAQKQLIADNYGASDEVYAEMSNVSDVASP